MSLRYGASACALLAACAASPALAADLPDGASDVSPVEVTATRSVAETDQLSNTVASLDRADIDAKVNALNTEDVVRYLPSLTVRKRHPGDTQAPLATRTSGVGSSARSLIYADGVLLSALVGNNNSSASPRWGMVSPDDVTRVDVLYGPFAAEFAGNSIGAVVSIRTRMPDRFEARGRVLGAWQDFGQYGTRDVYPSREVSGGVGDRRGGFSWRLTANRLDTRGQPLSYVTAARPSTPSGAGATTTGGFATLNRLGAPILVLGAGGLETQTQTNLTLKLAYDVGPDLRLSYALGFFGNGVDAGVETYLRDAGGAPVFAGNRNLGGFAYSIAPSAFSNGMYRLEERHWMQALSLERSGEAWDTRAVVSTYRYDEDDQRTPTTALPGARTGGAGTLVSLAGTNWVNADLRLGRRPGGGHALSFGLHLDRYELSNTRRSLADWRDSDTGPLASQALGKTRTLAVWAQDAVTLTPDLTLTLGGRYEAWKAYNGVNYSAAPALSLRQPERSAGRFSPKASLAWTPAPDWRLSLSYGDAWRFPTVSELYQTVATGPVLTAPNPDLKPEHARSAELAAQWSRDGRRLRLSLFDERVDDALISQTAPLLPGSSTLFSYVQNVDRTHARGVELAAQATPRPDLELSGSLTWTEAETERDAAFPAAEGKRLPQVPEWRATATAVWRPNERLSLSLSGRYASRSFATIDNADRVGHTYQGFEAYLVFDARAEWRLSDRVTAAVGTDNLGGRDYFLFHPFPQRTAFAELRFRM